MISLISPSEVKHPTSIAIGSFDGLHAGHRKLIESVVKENDYIPTIASFIVLISPLLLNPNLKLAPTEILFACN